jgi:F0F1-type ATP synthase membrane subunit b/b'
VSGNSVLKCWFTVVLLSISTALAGEQEKRRSLSNLKTPVVALQQRLEREKNYTKSAQNNSPDEIASAAQTLDDDETNEQFKNSPSLKWMAETLRISTTVAYKLSATFNFVALVTLIAIPLRSKLPAIFRKRTELIRQGLDGAQKASAEATQRLLAIESRLAKIGCEIATIQSIADQQWQQEEERIRAAAEENKCRISKAAEHEIAAAVNQARRELKAYAADLAVTLAATRIQVDVSTDEELVRSFIQQLERNGSE